MAYSAQKQCQVSISLSFSAVSWAYYSCELMRETRGRYRTVREGNSYQVLTCDGSSYRTAVDLHTDYNETIRGPRSDPECLRYCVNRSTPGNG